MTDKIALALELATRISAANGIECVLGDAQNILDWYKYHEEAPPAKKPLQLDIDKFKGAEALPKRPNFHRPITMSSAHNEKDSGNG